MTVVASGYSRKSNELYQTEPWAVEALLRKIPMEKTDVVWEPAAGNHNIAEALSARGVQVRTSDIANYTKHHDEIFNFLTDFNQPNFHYNAIITNPPYGQGNRDAAKFARIALGKCSGWIALLLTGKFDFGKTRADLFAGNPRFWAKLALVDRIQWFPGEYSSGTEDHAWYIWMPKEMVMPVWQPMCLYGGKE